MVSRYWVVWSVIFLWAIVLCGGGGHAFGAGEIVISELMYHPPEAEGVDGSELEYLEIQNIGDAAVDLSGAYFDNGVVFSFPEGSQLQAGGFFVIASNEAALSGRYEGLAVGGEYEGQLNNAGEHVSLVDALGATLFEVDYGDSSPWPSEADGSGKSLVLRSAAELPSSPEDYTVWRASLESLGSPGRSEPVADIVEVVINEVLTHTDEPLVDAIELYNPTNEAANIGSWYISDEYDFPKKYRIPDESVVAAGGYFVLEEDAFGVGETGFSLSSHGESLWLFSADQGGELSGYADGIEFGAAENGVSFGRYILSTGELFMVAMESRTLGSGNGAPAGGEVVITEIAYEPSEGSIEYVELLNTSGSDVLLYDVENPNNTWRINGLGFEFPTGLILRANQMAIVSNVDPTVFRDLFGALKGVMILGPYSGALDNSGERLSLSRPDSPDVVDGEVYVPYIDVDVVDYDDKAPWPVVEDGAGTCIEKLGVDLYGRDGENWSRSLSGEGSPGWVRGMNYEIWKTARFSSAELDLGLEVAPGEDYDGDGVMNLWEYATGDLPGISFEGISDVGNEALIAELSVVRSVYAGDVEWQWMRASELEGTGKWTLLDWNPIDIEEIGKGRERVRLEDVRNEGSGLPIFYRVEVKQNQGG